MLSVPRPYDLPALRSEEEFEDLVCDVLAEKFRRPLLQRLGRRGQSQYGIDGYDPKDAGGIVWQATIAKNGLDKKLRCDLSLMDNGWPSTPRDFIYAVASPRDERLQRAALELSEQRGKLGRSQVLVLFREEILQEVASSPRLLRKYYPEATRSEGENPSQPSIADARTARERYLARLRSYSRRRWPLRRVVLRELTVTLHDVEVPAHVVPVEGGPPQATDGGATVERRSLLDVLEIELGVSWTAPYLCVVGEAGGGKSTLAEQTAIGLAERARSDSAAPLPLLVTAADVPELSDRTGRYSPLLPKGEFASLLEERWIYLVDGYDEVHDTLEREKTDAALDELVRSSRTAAVVLLSRPGAAPPSIPRARRYAVAPWSEAEAAMFMHRWTDRTGTTSLDSLSSTERALLLNPLSATLFVGFRTKYGAGPETRAAVFTSMTESVFEQWASERHDEQARRWRDVAREFQKLAFDVLRSGRSHFSPLEFRTRIKRSIPGNAQSVEHLATNELGLVTVRPDGDYEFLLAPLAEHLAGCHIARLTAQETMDLATDGWAEEPIRHAIGIHVEEGRLEDAIDLIKALCDGATSEFETVYTLRRVGIAAQAAADIGNAVAGAAEPLSQALLAHLTDESSVWRAAEAQRFAAAVLSAHPPTRVAAALAEKIRLHLEKGSDTEALRYIQPEFRGFYHRDDLVRIATTRKAALSPDTAGIRNCLYAMLHDWGNDLRSGVSVAAEAGLGLRRASRDADFEALTPHLLEMLRSGSQVSSGGAACALRPDEAAPKLLALALQHFSGGGFLVPHEVIAELKAAEGGAEALAEYPLSNQRSGFEPDWIELDARAVRAEGRPSNFIRSVLERTLSTYANFSHQEIRRTFEDDGAGSPTALEAFAQLARRGESCPLVEALWDASQSPDSFVRFTSECSDHIVSAVHSPEVLSALVGLWKGSCPSPRRLNNFPGHALEPFLEADPHAAEVYAEWLTLELNGITPMPTIPVAALTVPIVRRRAKRFLQEAVDHAFDGRIHNGGRTHLSASTTSRILARLRPLWLSDNNTTDRVLEWLHERDPEKVAAALGAFGPALLPADEHTTVLKHVAAARGSGTPYWKSLQLDSIAFCASVGRTAELHKELLQIARSEDAARFSAGAALVSAGNDEARRLAVELAQTWPGPNWSFWYSRRNDVLTALVAAAPNAWASRITAVGAGELGLQLAETVASFLPPVLRTGLLRTLADDAQYWPLPWIMVLGPKARSARLLDAALQAVYRSGVGRSAMLDAENE